MPQIRTAIVLLLLIIELFFCFHVRFLIISERSKVTRFHAQKDHNQCENLCEHNAHKLITLSLYKNILIDHFNISFI